MSDDPLKGKTPESHAERGEFALTLDSNVFCLAAVKKAAYRYMHSLAADISVRGNEVRCVLHFRPTLSEAEREQLVHEFRKEVLDQDLRERLKAETEAVRNLILAHAFSKAGLSDEQVSED